MFVDDDKLIAAYNKYARPLDEVCMWPEEMRAAGAQTLNSFFPDASEQYCGVALSASHQAMRKHAPETPEPADVVDGISVAEVLLHCGEMSEQEQRTAMAVLNYAASKLRDVY